MQEIANYTFTFLANNDSYLSCLHPRPPELSSKWSERKESTVNSVKRLHDKQLFGSVNDNTSSTIKAISFHLPFRNWNLKNPLERRITAFFIKTKRKFNALTSNRRMKKVNILHFSLLLILKLKFLFCLKMSHSKTHFKFFKFLGDSCIKYIGQCFKNYFSSFVNENSMKQPEDYTHLVSKSILLLKKEIYY